METRKIAHIVNNPLRPGFLGRGHLAAAVIEGGNFAQTDPFILLMDDHVDLPGGPPVGGPHPHAGFETVTLVIKGDEKVFKTGSLEVMTAGKGIIHTEELAEETQLRILQLWLVLPPGKRWAEPFWQLIPHEHVPTINAGGNRISVYSGNSQGLTSPLLNHVPFTLVDFNLEKDNEVSQELPATYNGFVYVLEGEVRVQGINVAKGQTAWLERPESNAVNGVVFIAGKEGTRFILYAGEPQRAPIVSHGPFIGDTQEDIGRLYREYRAGKMPHLNDLPPHSKIIHGQ